MGLVNDLLKSRLVTGWFDEAIWDAIKSLVRKLGGHMNETRIHEEDKSGKSQVRVDRQVDRPPKVEYTDKLALTVAEMMKTPDGREAVRKLGKFADAAILGTDPLPGGEDQFSKGISEFIPPQKNEKGETQKGEWDYKQGAENLIALFTLEEHEVYTTLRVVTKDHIAETMKRFADILTRFGIHWISVLDDWMEKKAPGIKAGTALARLKREEQGKENPDNIKELLVAEHEHLAAQDLSKEEITELFRARGYGRLLVS